MSFVTLAEAQTGLAELIHRLTPGEEVVITEDNKPVARLIGQPIPEAPKLRPPPGLGQGMITIIADDDDHLKDFAEYMP